MRDLFWYLAPLAPVLCATKDSSDPWATRWYSTVVTPPKPRQRKRRDERRWYVRGPFVFNNMGRYLGTVVFPQARWR